MLVKLLAEIRAGGSLETGRLAQRLGTSPELIGAMLEHLQRMGLIEDYTNCGQGCGGCSLLDSCGTHTPVRLWHDHEQEG